jgi:Uncharacterized protein conserved in bacteria (DUF2262)
MLRLLLALLLLALPAALRAEEQALGTQAAPVIISGVVLEHEGGYDPRVLSESWNQWFTVVAWRKGDGPVQTTQMSVEFTANTREEFDAVLAQLPEKQVVRFTIAGDLPIGNTPPEATLREVLPPVPDAELLAAGLAVLNPPPLVDPQFGTFAPLRSHDMFAQESEWLGQNVGVLLWLDMRFADTQARTLTTLRKAWDGRAKRDKQAREELSRFHALWREEFQRPGQPALSRTDFRKRLRLVSISAFDSGAFDFHYALDGVPDFPVMRFGVYIDGSIETDVP